MWFNFQQKRNKTIICFRTCQLVNQFKSRAWKLIVFILQFLLHTHILLSGCKKKKKKYCDSMHKEIPICLVIHSEWILLLPFNCCQVNRSPMNEAAKNKNESKKKLIYIHQNQFQVFQCSLLIQSIWINNNEE